ncbi:MAG: tetratricopeptide repeat protein [Dehalococcoidia bacterium]|nr:tetratricopeptide repeat protein [Dehalococcoidia bacterium]
MPTKEELFGKGLGAYGKGNLDEAIAAFKEALQVDPGYADAYFAIANSYNKKGNLDEAISAIKKAIELDPQEVLYHTELSRLYVQLKMIPEAEAAKAEAMRLQRSR